MPTGSVYRQFDFSGGVQKGTTRLLRKRNELDSVKNGDFSYKIGACARRLGYEQVGQTIQYGNDSMGFHVYKYNSTGTMMLAALNDVSNVTTQLNVFDVAGYWKLIGLPALLDPYSKLQFVDGLNYSFVVGKSDALGTYVPTFSLNSQQVTSNTRNVFAAPRGKYIASYQGKLYLMNVQVNGKNYPDRMYVSSAPQGVITFIQGPQSGPLTQLHVDTVKYIKVGMVLDIYSGGTYALQAQAITVVWVDKKANNFGFASTQLTLKDRDEVWLTGIKGTNDALSYLWNTDHPTNEASDWIGIPAGRAEDPSITGWGENNNRLLIFTKDTTWKWDGANLINISEQIGCTSHESIKTIGNWTMWFHSTGVWGYNDAFGQFKLLSRSVQPYILAIKPGNYGTISAVAAGRKYKISVGQIQVPDASTTSTSTSSTSTSSTSVSTSSTSTSSTSTSSSTTLFTTSTSSTSASTSSTSTSSTSTSSTSSSSSISSTSSSTSVSTTSTTTVAATKRVTRLVYDFDLNIWSVEEHSREIRYQVMHEMTGYLKPYFTDDTGKVFRDETGNTDAGDLIPFEMELGRTNFGTETVKNYIAAYIESENARGAKIFVSIQGITENPQYQELDQIQFPIDNIQFPAGFTTGRDISYKIVHMDIGDRPVIIGLATFYSALESGHGRNVGRR